MNHVSLIIDGSGRGGAAFCIRVKRKNRLWEGRVVRERNKQMDVLLF